MGSIYTIEVPSGHRLKIEADSPDEALKAADGWKAPTSAKDTAYDVAASGAAGLGEGAADLIGSLGDVRNAAASGADYLANKIGLNPQTYDTIKNIGGKVATAVTPGLALATKYAPTSDEVQKRIEGITGEFHAPTTDLGRYAKSATKAIPATLIGPEGLAVKLGVGAASGLGGQAFADAFSGSPYEGWARSIGSVIGGVGAGAAGKGLEAARNFQAATSAGKEIGSALGTDPVKAGAVRRAAQSAADDALSIPGAAATQANLGPEAMVMDLGRQLQGRAEAVAVQPGKAQNTVLNAVEDRTGEFGSGARSRIEDTLEQHLGPTQNVVKLMDDVDALVQKHAAPAYEKVMADYPVINIPSEITSRPAIANAMKNAESLALNYGEKLGTTETKTLLSGDGYHIADDVTTPAKTSLKYWDYVKKGLDQRVNNMMKHGIDDLSSKDKADLGGLLNAKKSLVDYLDGVTGGAYADARRIAATKPELHEAMDFGRSIFNTKLLPEEVHAHIQGLSIPEQAMVQVGARRELARVLDSSRNDGAKARSFLDTNNNHAKIYSLFGSEAAKAIENRVAAENTFQNATQTIARNSRTAVRQELIKDTETPAPARLDTTLTGLALKPVKAGFAYALEHGMNNTRQDIAKILTAKGGQISPVVEQLLKYNQKRASNAATPLNQQASALIRALIAGSAGQ